MSSDAARVTDLSALGGRTPTRGVQFCRHNHTIKGILLNLSLVHPINKIHYEFKKLLAPYCWHHLWDRCHNPSITDCDWSASIDWWFSTTNMG